MRSRLVRARLVGAVAGLAFAAVAATVGAQETDEFPVPNIQDEQVSAPLLTVDFERLFVQSAFGQRIAQDFTEARDNLANENRRIAAALRQEELALTEQRATMAPDVFRTEAEAFDAKAQGIRRAQDAKETALNEMLSDGRDQFLSVTRPILGQLMIDSGAVAILDRQSVLLSLSSVDITDEAVSRINAAIGDGSIDAADVTPVPEIAPAITPEPTPEGGADTGPDVVPDVVPEN